MFTLYACLFQGVVFFFFVSFCFLLFTKSQSQLSCIIFLFVQLLYYFTFIFTWNNQFVRLQLAVLYCGDCKSKLLLFCKGEETEQRQGFFELLGKLFQPVATAYKLRSKLTKCSLLYFSWNCSIYVAIMERSKHKVMSFLAANHCTVPSKISNTSIINSFRITFNTFLQNIVLLLLLFLNRLRKQSGSV